MMKALDERHKEEIEFHDRRIDKPEDYGRGKKNFYSVEGLAIAHKALLKEVGDFNGKKVLDFGCGEGWAAIDYGKQKANSIVALDISGSSLRSAKKNIAESGQKLPIHLIQMAGENMGFKDGSFDLILGNAILHHTDLETTIKEIQRVLKKEGRGLFVEPLAHNPIINLFRRLTPWRRSKYEQPIHLNILYKFINDQFKIEMRGYYLFSTFALATFLVLITMRILTKFDEIILRCFKCLNRYCFAGLFIFTKP
jgi:ubiquinone/menaquinone biosynthesis C-methylase UbiE